jgi:multimeric flavodoxin WrbA
MKAVFIYEKNKTKLAGLASSMEEVLKSSGFDTAKCEIGQSGQDVKDSLKSLSGADLIIIGAESPGWDGTLPENIKNFISSCAYLEGRKTAVFLAKKMFGDKKALKNLMRLVEERGGFLFDFDTIAGETNAKGFAHRLKSLKK